MLNGSIAALLMLVSLTSEAVPPSAADGQQPSSSRGQTSGAVAVAESNPNIVFIGTGESCIRGNIQPGDGAATFANAGYRRLVGNAVTWVARRP